jgi:beta-glucosidase/6-phospho-beta-glucosidase/beta-galactosidase
MKVMLTLFHHSAPKWMAAYGGLVNPVAVAHFAQFADIVVDSLGDLVDYWVPFNEPTVFVGLTYCAGAWPPGFPEPGPLTSGFCMMAPAGLGNYSRAMAHVALAHRAAAKSIRSKFSAPIGYAAQPFAVPCCSHRPCNLTGRLLILSPQPLTAPPTTSRTCPPPAPWMWPPPCCLTAS